MKQLLQKLAKGPSAQAAESGVRRLTLAAFGKHPGWDDHMPGIGIETDTLAHVKQTLYVSGIGGQIDSGTWEKLEPDKRMEGFAHTFLWLRGGHAILGQMWSSKDGKGRSKYPMVLAIDGEHVTADFMLTALRGGLENLREVCKSAGNAGQVLSNCRAAQEQLRLAPAGNAGAAAEARALPDGRRFLERPELGPGRTGLLRVLHELAAAFDLDGNTRPLVRGGSTSPRALNLRVPFASDSEDDALLLWASFLGSSVGASIPLLLIARAGTDWLDAMIGEPGGDDFFCLQASLKGLPLATQIPYELTAESRRRLAQLEDRFLRETPSAIENPAGTSPKPVLPVPPSANAFEKSGPPPAPSGKDKGKGNGSLAVGGAVLILAGLIWFLANGDKRSHENARSESNAPAKAPVTEQKQAARSGVQHSEEPAPQIDHAGYQAAQQHLEAATPQPQQSGSARPRHTNSLGMEFLWFGALPGGGAYVAKYDVTRKQYRAEMKDLPDGEHSVSGDDNMPVANVTFDDAARFCQRLGESEHKPYSLPTKEQWLAIAGLSDYLTNRQINVWNKLRDNRVLEHEITSLSEDRTLKGPEKVGLAIESNGLCDLFGNVREWTAGRERAGFSYSCNGTTQKLGKLLFLDNSFADTSLLRETGFRCILQEKK